VGSSEHEVPSNSASCVVISASNLPGMMQLAVSAVSLGIDCLQQLRKGMQLVG